MAALARAGVTQPDEKFKRTNHGPALNTDAAIRTSGSLIFLVPQINADLNRDGRRWIRVNLHISAFISIKYLRPSADKEILLRNQHRSPVAVFQRGAERL